MAVLKLYEQELADKNENILQVIHFAIWYFESLHRQIRI